MSDQVRRDRAGYYRALEWTQKGDLDVTAWLLWFFETLRAAFDRSGETLAGIERRDAFWRRHAAASLNERQLKVLRRLLEDDFEGFVTSSKWARLTGTSQDTAGRDIRDLVERGVLKPNAEGGRSTSYRLAADE
jgi:Fic family protein